MFAIRFITSIALGLGLTSALAAGCRSKPLDLSTRLTSVSAASTELPAQPSVAEQDTDPAPAPPRRQSLPQLTDKAKLADYLTHAALNNPGLEAAFHRWRASLERAAQVTVLPDPRFTYRYMIEEVETRVGPQKQGVSLQQVFPWFGKLALRGDAAAQAMRADRKRYDAVRLSLFKEVTDVYCEYYYLGRAIGVVRENRDLVAHLEEVARTRFKMGAAPQAEVIRAQVELGKLQDTLRSLEDLRGPIVARLNAAMSRPTGADLPQPERLEETAIEATDDEVLAWYRDANPELAALTHEIERRRVQIELAKKEYFPDVTLGLDYTDVGGPPRASAPGLTNPGALRSVSRIAGGMGDAIDAYAIGKSFERRASPSDAGKDVWVASVSINLPIHRSKYAAGEREANARYREALAARKDRENNLAARVTRVLYDFRDAKRKISLYRDTLLPKARQNMSATDTAYRTGRSDFLDLVDAERALLEFQLSYQRALADHLQSLPELEMLVGRTIRHRTNPAENGTLEDAPAQGAPIEVTP